MAVMTATRTTIGQKALMAVTGVIWVGFLAMHMWGNTKAFWGPEVFNAYAHHLRTFGEPILNDGQFLMLFRVFVVTALLIHIIMAANLTRRGWEARGNQRYAVKKNVQGNAAARSMRWGGVAIFIFLLYHLMMFTWGVKATLPEFDRATPYQNMVAGFQNPLNVVIYLAALVAVGLHLYHGAWSVFQTLGWNNFRSTRGLEIFAWVIALVITIGFAAVPIAVSLGIITLTSAPFMPA